MSNELPPTPRLNCSRLDEIMKPANITIQTQGAARVNAGYTVDESSIVAIEIDMHSKRCTVDAFITEDKQPPKLLIGTDSESLSIDESKRGECTTICFEDYIGWRFFCAEICRYTLRVVLYKQEPI